MTNRKELIEEAAATIAVAELVRTRRTWGDLFEPQKDEYRRVASAVLAVFEKAQAPTDDERKVPNFAVREKSAERAWEFYVNDGSGRRMSHDFRGGYHQGMIDGFRRPAQTEPTGAQVLAALNGYKESDWRLARHKSTPASSHSLSDWDEAQVIKMRAALKAASTAGQTDEGDN